MGFLEDLAGPIGGAIGFAVGGPAGAAIGSSIGGAIGGASAQKEATRAGQKASDAAIAEQRAAREAFEARGEPFRQLGTAAVSPLQELLGIQANPEFARVNADIDAQIAALRQQAFDPSGVKGGLGLRGARNLLAGAKGFESDIQSQIQALEAQRESQLSGLQQFTQGDRLQGLEEINPVVDFLRNQGFEQIQESAAAQGRLGAGGTLEDLTTFNTQLASTVIPQLQNQRFNQLFNTAQLGANVAAGQGGAALQTGANVSNLLSAAGRGQQAGILGQQQAILGGVENIGASLGAFPGLFGGQPPPVVSNNPLAAPSFAGGPAPVVDISTF